MQAKWNTNDLRDRVGYELWIVRMLSERETEGLPTFSYDLDRMSASVGLRDTIGDPVAFARGHFPPLLFSVEFKMLDMFFEWMLAENRLPVPWSFSDRLADLTKHLSNLVLPPPLDSDARVAKVLFHLYRQLVEPRNAIVHRHEFKVVDGTLEVHDRGGGVILSLPPGDEAALRRLVLTLLDSVCSPSDPAIAISDLRALLDRLSSIHGEPAFGDFIDPDQALPLLRKELQGAGANGRLRFEVPLKLFRSELDRLGRDNRRFIVEIVVRFNSGDRLMFRWDSVLFSPGLDSVSVSESDYLWTRGRV